MCKTGIIGGDGDLTHWHHIYPASYCTLVIVGRARQGKTPLLAQARSSSYGVAARPQARPCCGRGQRKCAARWLWHERERTATQPQLNSTATDKRNVCQPWVTAASDRIRFLWSLVSDCLVHKASASLEASRCIVRSCTLPRYIRQPIYTQNETMREPEKNIYSSCQGRFTVLVDVGLIPIISMYTFIFS